MHSTRRLFLRQRSFAATAAATARSGYAAHDMRTPIRSGAELLDTSALTRYVDPLPIPPIARPSGVRPDPSNASSSIPYYRVPMRQFRARFHRDMPPTTQWGYAGTCPGPTFEARRGQPLLIEWVN